ncbi:MAG: hypothetical protein JWM80_5789 [Cyanobacteria bacterium RYN_339]|nr:hypothetical protein [Cyanobacteria bacterium RYN_339]
MQAVPMTEDLRDRALALLRARRETSMYLLGNLEQHGPGPTASLNSGMYQCLVDGETVRAVFVLTRRGNLLAQTDHQGDYSDAILEAVRPVPTKISGFLGDWPIVEGLARRLPDFKPTFSSKDCLFYRPLGQEPPAAPPEGAIVRRLTALDFSAWDELIHAFMAVEGIPIQGTLDEREANFKASVERGSHWGASVNGRLLSLASLNTRADGLGQVGGVYTTPPARRMGLSKAVMQGLIHDSAHLHGLTGLTLFTGEENLHAQAMYRSMGFQEIGHFGMIFGG